MIFIGPHWRQVNIFSDNGFVLSGNKAITWANVDIILCCHKVSLGHDELTSIVITAFADALAPNSVSLVIDDINLLTKDCSK